MQDPDFLTGGGPDGAACLPCPRLAGGVLLLGGYDSSGLRHPRYLAQRGDGQTVLLSETLYLIAHTANGERSPAEIADELAARSDRTLGAAGVAYLIDTKLKPLGLITMGAEPAVAPVARPLLALAARWVLMPPRAVGMIASAFRFLFFPPIVLAVLFALGGLDAWLLATHQVSPALNHMVAHPLSLLVVVGLLVAATLFHEWGHAAGCRYGGGRPGAIGMGIYLIFPAFYTNVTDSYRLSRRGRLRTDLGGVYFNVVFMVLAGAVFAVTGYLPLVVLVLLSHFEILEQLLPIVRLDGYFVLADLVGVPDLFARIRPVMASLWRRGDPDPRVAELTGRTRTVVTAWVLVVVPLLAGSLGLLLWQLPHLVEESWRTGSADWHLSVQAIRTGAVGTAVLALISLLLLMVPGLGLSILAFRTANWVRRCFGRARGVHWRSGIGVRARSLGLATGKRARRKNPADVNANGPRLASGALLTATLIGGWTLPACHHPERTVAANSVVVMSRGHLTQQADLGWQVAGLEGKTLTATNTAVAYARCSDCLSEAVAIQIIQATTTGTMNATNRAVAINQLCYRCHTLALAYQFVVVSKSEITLTPAGSAELAAIHRNLRSLIDTKPPPATLAAYASQVAVEIDQILTNRARLITPPAPHAAALLPAQNGPSVASSPQVEVHFAEQTT